MLDFKRKPRRRVRARWVLPLASVLILAACGARAPAPEVARDTIATAGTAPVQLANPSNLAPGVHPVSVALPYWQNAGLVGPVSAVAR